MRRQLAGEPQQGVQERVGAALDGPPVARLVWPVAAPALGGNEEHARVRHQCQVLGVVARAGGHPLDLELEAGRRGFHGPHDSRRAARGLALRDRLDRHGELPLLRDAPGEGHALALEARQLPLATINLRARSAYSAPAMKASRRQAMGVVPAWSAWPVKVTQFRRLPTMPSTTPIGIF